MIKFLMAFFFCSAFFSPCANLLKNGSFEDDLNRDNIPDNWTPQNFYGGKIPKITMDSEEVKEGSSSLRIDNTGGTSGGVQQLLSIPAQDSESVFWVTVLVKLEPPLLHLKKTHMFGISFHCYYTDGTAEWEVPSGGYFEPAESLWQNITFIWKPRKPLARAFVRINFPHDGMLLVDGVKIHYAHEMQPAGAGPFLSEILRWKKLPSDGWTVTAGDWTAEKGIVSNKRPRFPGGDHLLFTKGVLMPAVEFRIRKESGGFFRITHYQESSEYVQTTFRDDRVAVKYFMPAFTARPRDRQHIWENVPCVIDSGWHTVKVEPIFPAGIKVSVDGRPVIYTADDWKPWDLGQTWLALTAWNTTVSIDSVKIAGRMPSLQLAPPRYTVSENPPELLLPAKVIDAPGLLSSQGNDRLREKHSGKLPSVGRFEIGKPDYSGADIPRQTMAEGGPVLSEQNANIGWNFRAWLKKPSEWESLEIRRDVLFNLSESGVYTLKCYFSDLADGEQYLKLYVDDTLVYTDRASGTRRSALGSSNLGRNPWREHIPIRFSSGEHKIGIAIFAPTFHTKFANIPAPLLERGATLDYLALVPGEDEVVYKRSVQDNIGWEERHDDPAGTEIEGRKFRLVFTDVPDGNYTLEMGFRVPRREKPEEREFVVSSGEKILLRSSELQPELAWEKRIVRNVSLAVSGGRADMLFTASKGKAVVNWVRLLADSGEIAYYNAGFVPGRNRMFKIPRHELSKVPERKARNAAPPGYDAGNGIANPSFEYGSGEEIMGWAVLSKTDLLDAALPGNGTVALEDGIARSGNRSLKIDRTTGKFGIASAGMYVDYTKSYRYNVWLKGEKITGRVYIQVIFFDSQWGWGHKTTGIISSDPFAVTEKWQRFELTVKPPMNSQTAYLVVRSEDNGGVVWIDDVFCDPVGDESVEIMESQAGYHPFSSKKVVVWTKKEQKEGIFRLVDAATGKSVEKGKLEVFGWWDWAGRYCYLADFSSYTMQGNYVLDVEFRGGIRKKCPPFPISADAYLQVARTGTDGLYIMRQGEDIPGLHEPVFLDDAILPGGRSVDTAGGWWDAGDTATHLEFAFSPIYALAELEEWFCPQWQREGKAVREVSDELWWGTEWALRCITEDGSVLSGAYGSWSAAGDSVPGLGVDRLTWSDSRMYQCGMALARASLALRRTDPEKAQRALAGAVFFYEPMVRAWDDNNGEDVPSVNAILDIPKILLTEIYLAKATGKAQYIANARKHCRKNIEVLKEKAYFDERYLASNDFTGGYAYSAIPLDFAWAPIEFALRFPDDPLIPEIRSAVKNFMEEAIVPITAQGPFKHAGEWHAEPLLWNIGRYTSSYYNAVAHVSALAAMLLNEPRYLEIAERQFQWSCGANVRGVIFMSGMGHKENGIGSYVFAFPESQMNKRGLYSLPGLVSKNWNFGKGKVPAVVRGAAEAPFGSFCQGYITGTVPGNPGRSEYTTNHTGNMILAAVSVHRAIKHFSGHTAD